MQALATVPNLVFGGTEGEGWFAFPKNAGEKKQQLYASVLSIPRLSITD